MAATCDHLLWGAANLDVGIAALEERTDVRATAGGQHPDLGTHNAIAALAVRRLALAGLTTFFRTTFFVALPFVFFLAINVSFSCL